MAKSGEGRGGKSARERERETGVRNGWGEAGREKKQGKGRKRFEGRRGVKNKVQGETEEWIQKGGRGEESDEDRRPL